MNKVRHLLVIFIFRLSLEQTTLTVPQPCNSHVTKIGGSGWQFGGDVCATPPPTYTKFWPGQECAL